MRPSIPRRLLCFVLGLVSLVLPAHATWSIVTINLRTGEVGVASATCLQQLNLRAATPVVVVGKGAAACQSLIDTGAVNRMTIWSALQGGVLTPDEILNLLSADPIFNSRQYGLLAFTGGPVTFTGNGAGAAATGVTGTVGDYVYAVQGNVLTDDSVVYAAELAFRDTNGDMGQRLMAAMEAARALGGDGRCSCSNNNPTGCGAPPASFTKSAHVGYLIVARIGDPDGGCNAIFGCASAKYYLAQNVAGANGLASSLDPVLQLQDKYDFWRAARVGRADGIESTVDSVDALPADGVTQRTVTIQLNDIDGAPLPFAGSRVDVTTEDGLPSLASVGPILDLGAGKYEFTLTAGTTPGTDTFIITASAGPGRTATLYPYLTVRSEPADGLNVGYDEVSASASPRVPFVVHAPSAPGARYLIVASLDGTLPGSMFGDVLLPLNRPLLSVLNHAVDDARLPGTFGRLDSTGRADGAFVPGVPLLTALIGRRIDWSVVVAGDGARFASPAVGFDVIP